MALVRNGGCVPTGATCSQRFVYDWDEVGRLARARRWDLALPGAASDPVPATTPDAELRYAYDSSDQRVIKTAVDSQQNESHTVYVSPSIELRRTAFSNSDYVDTRDTEVGYLFAHGVRLARLAYAEDSLPTLTSGHLHVLLELPDYLGSSATVLDLETSELLERSTYQAHGAPESDYRPARWNGFREDYRFTGKEEDAEVGLAFFGARYLATSLGRWLSPDPLELHARGGDANLYAYVRGGVLRAIDPLGLDDEGGAGDVKDVDAGAPEITDASTVSQKQASGSVVGQTGNVGTNANAIPGGTGVPQSASSNGQQAFETTGAQNRSEAHDARTALQNFAARTIESTPAVVVANAAAAKAGARQVHLPVQPETEGATAIGSNLEFLALWGSVVAPQFADEAAEAYTASRVEHLASSSGGMTELLTGVKAQSAAASGLADANAAKVGTNAAAGGHGELATPGVIYPRGPGASVGDLPPGYTNVSRWVDEAEAKRWLDNGGTYIPSGIGGEAGRVYVTLPGASQPAGTGSIRIDFSVAGQSLKPAGAPDWRQIFQPVQHMPIHNVTIYVP